MSLSAARGMVARRILARQSAGDHMYRLFGVQDFANLAVHVALEEAGVPYEAVFLDMDAGDLQSQDHLARHPMGLVPAMQTPDGMMFETGAILLYLGERHGLAPAQDAAERGVFLSWFVFANNGLHTAVMDLIHPYRVSEEHARIVAEAARVRLMERMAVLEAVAVTRPGWLSPDQPGVLGIYISMLLRWMRAFPWAPDLAISAQDFPALHAVAAACEARPATLRAAAANGLQGRFFTDPEV
ncbi:MAG: glutathione S-transferase family protein [Rhodobacteraceae bacterium]|nr:glutathione S-transferase family protein [Paracoccaceae bacterium]MCZ8082930.1 glutathione S-transferase family protein [Paracoccaceae bacterium]